MDDVPLHDRRVTSKPDLCAQPQQDKARMRADLRSRRAQVSPQEQRDASTLLASRIADLAKFQAAHTIGIYWATPGEIDPALVAEHPSASGKTFVWPRTHVRERRLTFHTLQDATLTPGVPGFAAHASDALVLGPYGIKEPTGEEIRADTIDLLIVPGLGFDRHGARLGQGMGFYDRLLAATNAPKTVIGVGFDWQIIDSRVPQDPHDRSVHIVATPSKLISARTTGSRLAGTTSTKEI